MRLVTTHVSPRRSLYGAFRLTVVPRLARERRPERRAALDLRRQLGRRTGLQQQLVHPAQPLPLLRAHLLADQIVELRRPRHASSPSSRSASRASALRVRVLTVPSGMFRYPATSLCDISLQYASSTTSRSFSGS